MDQRPAATERDESRKIGGAGDCKEWRLWSRKKKGAANECATHAFGDSNLRGVHPSEGPFFVFFVCCTCKRG